MQQQEIERLLEKVNLLFSVLLKEGIENTTALERELLKEQINQLHHAIYSIDAQPVHQANQKDDKAASHTMQDEKSLETEAPSSSDEDAVIEPIQIEFVEESFTHIGVPKELEQEESENLSEAKENPPNVFFVDKVFSHNPPKRKLRDIIDLNKSFIFKAELFDDNMDDYQAFINKMDTIEDEKKSFEYLQEMIAKKNWNTEENVFHLMVRAVEKRFIPIL